MLILLPPSEGKTAPGRGRPLRPETLSFPSLSAARAEVLDALVSLCTTVEPDVAGRTLGVGKTQLDAVNANAALRDAPTARAERIYSGVLYEALDVASLDPASRRRATSWVAVTSGLFGLLRLNDHVPAYRLSGDVALPGVGGIAAYWKAHLDTAVVEGAGRGLIVDLRSSTYAAFWRPSAELARRVVTVRVLHEVGDTRKVVSHFNKATKGRLVRALLEDGSNPASPARFADHLAALGWKVELGEPGKHGVPLDVVVSDI